ncbi:MAG: 50S ribosomal protein L31 [Rickettsiales bacterium]
MKKDIHPAAHSIFFILTNGESFEVRSTYGKPGDKIKLDVDPLKHPAWQKDGTQFVNENAGKVAKFKSRFGSFSFTSGTTASGAAS